MSTNGEHPTQEFDLEAIREVMRPVVDAVEKRIDDRFAAAFEALQEELGRIGKTLERLEAKVDGQEERIGRIVAAVVGDTTQREEKA